MKRSMALLMATVVVVAIGCSSSKGSDEGAAGTGTTGVTAPIDLDPTDTTVAGSTDSTPSSPGVGSGDPVAFCAAYYDVQTLSDTMSGVLDLSTEGLLVLAAPDQAKAAADKIRQTAPSEVADAAAAYADLVQQAGDQFTQATTLRKLGEANAALRAASTADPVKPMVSWVVVNCSSFTPDSDVPA